MAKVIECAKVDPSSGCTHVVRGNTEEEVLKNATEHAKQHGIREVTPELMVKVKAAIRDEKEDLCVRHGLTSACSRRRAELAVS
jgi:predicted small metal-binding protein